MTITEPTAEASFPPSPVTPSFDKYRDAWEELMSTVASGGLDHFDNAQLLAFMQDLERFRYRTALLDHHLVAAVIDRDLAHEQCQPSTTRVLTSRLLISNPEARRRVNAAAAVGPRRSPLGQPLEPVRPVLAAAQAAGAASPEQADIITRALGSVDGRGFDPAAIDDGETLLADFASRFGPTDLKRLAQQVVDDIDPDGTEPDERVRERRSFELSRSGDHSWRCTGRLTAEAGIQLNAFLTAHAKPQPAVPDLPTGPGTSDERTRSQRMHDAIADLAARGLREGTVAQTTVGAATVIITIDADDLLTRTETNDTDTDLHANADPHDADPHDADPHAGADAHRGAGPDYRGTDQPSADDATGSAEKPSRRRWRPGTGHALSSDGSLVSIENLAVLAGEADIIPAWMSATGEILNLGRTRRCATRKQTLALIARDIGCSFPGCDRPPEWCERHHIISWLLEGNTDIDNLTLLCRYHHHNFEMRGWTCRINNTGLPEWTAPHWLDHTQTPLINTRITQRLAGRKHRRRGKDRS